MWKTINFSLEADFSGQISEISQAILEKNFVTNFSSLNLNWVNFHCACYYLCNHNDIYQCVSLLYIFSQTHFDFLDPLCKICYTSHNVARHLYNHELMSEYDLYKQAMKVG
jgi:hypothetical protein